MLPRCGCGNGRSLPRKLISCDAAEVDEGKILTMMNPVAEADGRVRRAAVPHEASWRGCTMLTSLHVSKLKRRVLQPAVVLSGHEQALQVGTEWFAEMKSWMCRGERRRRKVDGCSRKSGRQVKALRGEEGKGKGPTVYRTPSTAGCGRAGHGVRLGGAGGRCPGAADGATVAALGLSGAVAARTGPVAQKAGGAVRSQSGSLCKSKAAGAQGKSLNSQSQSIRAPYSLFFFFLSYAAACREQTSVVDFCLGCLLGRFHRATASWTLQVLAPQLSASSRWITRGQILSARIS